MKIEIAGIYWPQANIWNFYFISFFLLTYLRFSEGIHFVKAELFDCMSSLKSCFEFLKSHDKRSLLIEVEFYMHNRNSGNLVRKLRSQVRYKIEKGKLAKMSLFLKTNYLPRSQPPFRSFSRCGKIWDFPCIPRNKNYNKFKTGCRIVKTDFKNV